MFTDNWQDIPVEMIHLNETEWIDFRDNNRLDLDRHFGDPAYPLYDDTLLQDEWNMYRWMSCGASREKDKGFRECRVVVHIAEYRRNKEGHETLNTGLEMKRFHVLPLESTSDKERQQK